MGFLRKYIFANAGLKLLALAISFLLWATYTAEPYAEVGFQARCAAAQFQMPIPGFARARHRADRRG